MNWGWDSYDSLTSLGIFYLKHIHIFYHAHGWQAGSSCELLVRKIHQPQFGHHVGSVFAPTKPHRNMVIFQPEKNMGISWDAKLQRFRKTRSLGEHAMGISGYDVAIVHSLPSRPWCTKRLAWHPSGPGRWPAADTTTIAGEAPWWIFFRDGVRIYECLKVVIVVQYYMF